MSDPRTRLNRIEALLSQGDDDARCPSCGQISGYIDIDEDGTAHCGRCGAVRCRPWGATKVYVDVHDGGAP